MRKIYYLILIATAYMCLPVSAQTIKTYSGGGIPVPIFPFKMQVFGETFSGSYQYYENEMGVRIMHGKFVGDDLTCYLEGRYKHGKKDGTWEFIDGSKKNLKATLTFKDDVLTGPYKYIYTYLWDFVQMCTLYASGNYKEGRNTGTLHIDLDDYGRKIGFIDGAFDDMGEMHGSWKYEYIKDGTKHIENATFINGILSQATDYCDATGVKTVIYSDGLPTQPRRDTTINNQTFIIADNALYKKRTNQKSSLSVEYILDKLPRKTTYKILEKYKTLEELEEENRVAEEKRRQKEELARAKAEAKAREARLDSLCTIVNHNDYEIRKNMYDRTLKRRIYWDYYEIKGETDRTSEDDMTELIEIQDVIKQLRYKNTKKIEKRLKALKSDPAGKKEFLRTEALQLAE